MDSQLLYEGIHGAFLMNRNVALNYIKSKKRKKRVAITSLVCSLILTMFIIIAFCIIHVDRFTITINDNASLFLTIDETREVVTTKLEAPPLLKATDMQYSDLPPNIEDGLGSKNTNSYFSYSFYLGSNDSTNYSLSMTMNESSNELEEAIRIMIIRNGERTIYAKAKEDGSSKEIYNGSDRSKPDEILGYTIPFKDNKHIILEPYSIVSGEYDKYTVVMWIDGWESVNSMKGGNVQTDLKFSTLSTNI